MKDRVWSIMEVVEDGIVWRVGLWQRISYIRYMVATTILRTFIVLVGSDLLKSSRRFSAATQFG